jgi:hypothetical protein
MKCRFALDLDLRAAGQLFLCVSIILFTPGICWGATIKPKIRAKRIFISYKKSTGLKSTRNAEHCSKGILDPMLLGKLRLFIL